MEHGTLLPTVTIDVIVAVATGDTITCEMQNCFYMMTRVWYVHMFAGCDIGLVSREKPSLRST